MRKLNPSEDYKKGYSAGTAYLSNIRKYYSNRIQKLEEEIEKLKKTEELRRNLSK